MAKSQDRFLVRAAQDASLDGEIWGAEVRMGDGSTKTYGIAGADGQAEAARKEAESARTQAETARVSEESKRSDAESKRVQAETARAKAEDSRKAEETKRATAEAARASEESKRVAEEGKRVAAETERKRAEDSRKSAETARADAETARKAEESKRVTAEDARKAEETKRAQAETARAAEESKRADAETKRAAAETARADAESKRVKAETARATAETARATAEDARKSAETARETAQAKNNADQALNNEQMKKLSPVILQTGQYDPSTLRPTVTGEPNRVYFVPMVAPAAIELYGATKAEVQAGNSYMEWMWVGGKWELMGQSEMKTKPITTDQIDAVFAGGHPTGDDVLSLTGLDYVKSKADAAYAASTFRGELSGGDLNRVTAPGCYKVNDGGNIRNFPPNAYKWGVLEVSSATADGGFTAQTYTAHQGSDNAGQFFRCCYDGSWRPWQRQEFSGHRHDAGHITSGTLHADRIPSLPVAKVAGLQSALDGKQPKGDYAAASHTHEIADVDGLQSALDGKAAASHTHAKTDVTGLEELVREAVARAKLEAHPVGSYYFSDSAADPSSLFGGVWERVDGRFLFAADGDHANGSLGGAAEVSLAVGNMPAHSHGVTVSDGGAHSHGASTGRSGDHSHSASSGAAGSHTHVVGVDFDGAGGGSWSAPHKAGADGARHHSPTGWAGEHSHSVSVSSAGGHSHTVSVESGGGHSHTAQCASAGGGAPHENMPPYVAANCWRRTA